MKYKGWALASTRMFTSEMAADSYASRKNYARYMVAPFSELNKVNQMVSLHQDAVEYWEH